MNTPTKEAASCLLHIMAIERERQPCLGRQQTNEMMAVMPAVSSEELFKSLADPFLL